MSNWAVKLQTEPVLVEKSPAVSWIEPGGESGRLSAACEGAMIAVLALLAYLFGAGGYDLLTDDEIRYAEAGRQMVLRGDWIIPVYNGEPRFQKPLLIYWWQALSQAVLGSHALATRIPSALAAVLALLSTWMLARTVWDTITARWAVLVLGTMLEFFLLARMVLIDMLLVAFLQMGLAAVVASWRSTVPSRRRMLYLIAGLGLGLAICAKGPVALVLFGFLLGPLLMSGAFFERGVSRSNRSFPRLYVPENGSGHQLESGQQTRLAYLRQELPALLLACGVTIAVGLSSYVLAHWRTAGRFTWQFLVSENWERFTSVVNGHPQPIWFYLALLVPFSFPWTGAVPYALLHAMKSLRLPATPSSEQGTAPPDWRRAFPRALLLHTLAVFTFFTFSRTKVWTYTFPAMPSLALLIAHWLVSLARGQPELLRKRFSQAFGFGVIVCCAAALTVIFWPAERLPAEVRCPQFLTAIRTWAGMLVLIMVGWWFLSRWTNSLRLILAALLFGTLTWYAWAVYYVCPAVDRMWNGPVRQLARLWNEHPEAEVVTYHVHELGLNFHAGRDLVHHWRNESLPDLYERLRHPPPVLVLLDPKLRNHLRGLPVYVWLENNRYVLVANFPAPSFSQRQAD